VSPVQHCALVVHACAEGRQQRLVWQRSAPQHPSDVLHAPPVARQQRVVVGAGEQV
jgi:hypothetical protein